MMSMEEDAMKTDLQLHKDVAEELAYDPRVDDHQIGVATSHGVVTLTGKAASYYEKRIADTIVKAVPGVRGVVNNIEVELPGDRVRTDTDIAEAALSALAWHVALPPNLLVTVDHGFVTLSGIVAWPYQREAAEEAVRHLTGVISVRNEIAIEPPIAANEVERALERRLERRDNLAEGIQVEAEDGKVTLRGTVRSEFELEEASRAAWSVPGVRVVENLLAVN
jgi:osmotically-inducible protein OsmY